MESQRPRWFPYSDGPIADQASGWICKGRHIEIATNRLCKVWTQRIECPTDDRVKVRVYIDRYRFIRAGRFERFELRNEKIIRKKVIALAHTGANHFETSL